MYTVNIYMVLVSLLSILLVNSISYLYKTKRKKLRPRELFSPQNMLRAQKRRSSRKNTQILVTFLVFMLLIFRKRSDEMTPCDYVTLHEGLDTVI